MPRFGLHIPQIHQRLADRVFISVFALNLKHFPITSFGHFVVTQHRADVPEVAERIRETLSVPCRSIIQQGAFV